MTGFVASLEFLKMSSNLPSNFPDLEKVWKIEVKSWKIVKSLDIIIYIFFESFFFCFGQILFSLIHTMQGINKKALFLRRSLLITYLIASSLEKVLNFGSKNSSLQTLIDKYTYRTIWLLSIVEHVINEVNVIKSLTIMTCYNFNRSVYIISLLF